MEIDQAFKDAKLAPLPPDLTIRLNNTELAYVQDVIRNGKLMAGSGIPLNLYPDELSKLEKDLSAMKVKKANEKKIKTIIKSFKLYDNFSD